MVPKAVKRKPEDELPLPNIAIKKAKASSTVDGYHGDDDELQYSRSRWMDDSIRLSSDNLSQKSKENPVEEAKEVQQGGNGTNEEDQAYLDSEDHFKKQSIKQSIAIPDESNQTWESKQFSDCKLDIYPLNAAVQVQNELENLESEMVIRDRIPWESFKRELCRGCKAIVKKHLQAINRRQPENSGTHEPDVESRPNLGTRGGFDYFLGLPTLEELAKKQQDIETLRILRPISQEFPLEDLEPKLCEKCDKNLRTSGKLPAKAGAAAPVRSHPKQIIISSGSEGSLVHVTAEQPKQKPNVGKQPVPASGLGSHPPVLIDPPQKVPPKVAPPKQVTTKKAPTPQPFASDEPQPPAQADRPKREGPAPKPVAPEETQPAVQTERPKRKGLAPKAVAREAFAPEEPQSLAPVAPEETQPPTQAERPKRKGPAPKAVTPEEPQPPVLIVPEKSQPPPRGERPTRKAPAARAVAPKEPQLPASVAPEQTQPPAQAERPKRKGPVRKTEEPQPHMPVSPEEPQPPVQAERPKRQGPAPKAVAPEKPQPPVRNERPKRKGPASKAVASEEPQLPAPGGKPKKKEPTPGPIAPKEAEPIQPAAAKKPRKKPTRAGKINIPDPPPASPEPVTHGVDKAEDGIEEAGPIQRVMDNLPEKPKGHDYYCAICYTNLTRMGSAKKLEHLEKCGTTLGEVKVMTKAQAQAAKAAK